MRYLLDTHVLLFWTENDPRLTESVLSALSNPENELFFSAASGWEIAIKAGLKKLDIEGSPAQFLAEQMSINDISELPVQMAHVVKVYDLPMHHKDPFDRLLIAQAQVEGMTILSNDAKFRLYSVDVSW